MQWLLVVVVVSACFDPNYDRPACSASGACPSDWSCVSEYCERPGVGAALGDAQTNESPDVVPDLDAGFDYAQCPASYNASLPGPTRYRVIPDGHRAWEQSDNCNLDLPGATHLVILETDIEAQAVVAFMQTDRGIADGAVRIGAFQRRVATQTAAEWLGFDGRPLVDAWNPGEPNDLDDDEGDHSEQFVNIQRGYPGMNDSGGAFAAGALCECDGKALSADVIAAIDANRLPN